MGRMGCAPRMDRASSLLGTEVWRLTLYARPKMTSSSAIARSSAASFGQSMLLNSPGSNLPVRAGVLLPWRL